MKKKTIYGVISSLFITCALLTACGSDASNNSSNTTTSEITTNVTTEKASTETVTEQIVTTEEIKPRSSEEIQTEAISETAQKVTNLDAIETNYLDAVRGNLSTAGMKLGEIEKSEGQNGNWSYYFTFTNPNEPGMEMTVSTHRDDAGILDSVSLSCEKNTPWLYVYAYAVIGSLEGSDPTKTLILPELNLDQNNGYYGSELSATYYNNHFISISKFEQKLTLMIGPDDRDE